MARLRGALCIVSQPSDDAPAQDALIEELAIFRCMRLPPWAIRFRIFPPIESRMLKQADLALMGKRQPFVRLKLSQGAAKRFGQHERARALVDAQFGELKESLSQWRRIGLAGS